MLGTQLHVVRKLRPHGGASVGGGTSVGGGASVSGGTSVGGGARVGVLEAQARYQATAGCNRRYTNE